MKHIGLPVRFLLGAISLFVWAAPACSATPEDWIVTWAASPQAGEQDPDEPLMKIDGQTVRERVRFTLGGKRVRIRLSNEFGSSALAIESASVALSAGPDSVQPGSLRRLTFGGRASVRIPAGAPAISDPVELDVSPEAEVSISLFFPGRVETATLHSLALRRAVVSGPGDYTQAVRIEPAGTSTSSIAISAVMVPKKRSHRLVVAFGDSITDGAGSTADANQAWPAQFAHRIVKLDPDLAVANAGIAGNHLGYDGFGANGLARFERDVLSLPGVTHVVLFEGINDIAAPGAKIGSRYFAPPGEVRTAQEIISRYRQLIARAHDHHLKIIAATLTPFSGTSVPGFYSAEKEAVRQEVNAWIRQGGAFDGVIDFDAVLRDRAKPSELNVQFASRDRLHPNDRGYKAMADAIDPRIFR